MNIWDLFIKIGILKMAENSREEKPQPAPIERNCCATKFYMGFKEAQVLV